MPREAHESHEMKDGMTDTTHGDPAHIRADNLRAKSDALLKRCGHWQGVGHWNFPNGTTCSTSLRPHPYEDAQQAIDLAETMGLKIVLIHITPDGWRCRLMEHDGASPKPTIAEAICAAIEAALGDPA